MFVDVSKSEMQINRKQIIQISRKNCSNMAIATLYRSVDAYLASSIDDEFSRLPINVRVASPEKMFSPCSMILLASLVVSSKGDVHCLICRQTVFDNFCTIHNCGHEVCIRCLTKIVCSENPTCPKCTKRIDKVTGPNTYESELDNFKRAVVNDNVADERIIARYRLLPPWQVADQKMLQSVKAIVYKYDAVFWNAAIQKIRSNVDGYTFVEDVKERSKLFCFKFDEGETEVHILHQFYKRRHYDANNEYAMREFAYEWESGNSSGNVV
ncbi:uncharacterized protein LOC126899884 [Daktulosphaira vitifoliae]|uniref:uncharacterized protein LOC126899884 n=1 Tax=Daktulosphaira vitifoliae TaxID=58002 RepID=UPI0021A9886C|nr:uncharacterized protein LOC126899884 [Daktulosphaira vitifoliae]